MEESSFCVEISDFNNVDVFGTSYRNDLADRIKNVFWKDCLKIFNIFLPMSFYLHLFDRTIIYNPNICIVRKPFYYSNWHQQGISQIPDRDVALW